jgi:hypothetical protein
MARGLKREITVVRLNREAEEGSESHSGQTSHKLSCDGRCNSISILTVKSIDSEKSQEIMCHGENILAQKEETGVGIGRVIVLMNRKTETVRAT